METEIEISSIIVDMPVDEALVKSKMRMLERDGLIQPLAIWKQDLRVIDGFHRLEAAKRLGWEKVRCSIIDVSEEQFWASRIDSARQHHTVERPRLMSWIRQCWEASDYAASEAIIETLWRLRKRVGSGWELGNKRRKLHLSESETTLLHWFDQHAERWNMSTYDVFEAAVAELMGQNVRQNFDDIAVVAAKKDLPVDALVDLTRKMGFIDIGDGKHDVLPESVEKYIDAGMPDNTPIKAIDKILRKEQKRREDAEQFETSRQERLKIQAHERVAGECIQTRFDLERQCKRLEDWITQSKTLPAVAGGKEIIAQHIERMQRISAEKYPNDASVEVALQTLHVDAEKLRKLDARLGDVVVVNSYA